MTTYSMTISNGLNCFGIAPSNKWGDWNWGAFLWGEGTQDLPIDFMKVLDNSQASDTEVSKIPYHLISNDLTATGDRSAEYVQDAQGYFHVYSDRTTDVEQADTPTWASGTVTAPTYTSQAVGSTTWS